MEMVHHEKYEEEKKYIDQSKNVLHVQGVMAPELLGGKSNMVLKRHSYTDIYGASLIVACHCDECSAQE
ncbi:hypothetical protein C5167_022713 [Papaver somniferum]|uniref:Uncharacterized protein n=1 Tax=Papaver somniferum TaxID=3469 RepID=A0A4Y7JIR9_PAPSO|nr:hypothetical protein C5167_022713 [Papaver somniferum]